MGNIEHKIGDCQLGGLWHLVRASRERAHPRHYFAHGEGLHDIIIRTSVKPGHTRINAIACG